MNKSPKGIYLKEDFGLDSLGISNLIIKIEEIFDMEIELDLLVEMPFETIDDVCEIVRKSIGE